MAAPAPLPWPPLEPPKPRVQFPDLSALGDEWVVGVTRSLSPGLVLQAYRAGIFPWPSKPGVIPWASPEPRTVFPLQQVGRWPRSVRRDLKAAAAWTITFDAAFPEVMRACAERPGEGTWIIDDLYETYVQLHQLGWGHSIEVWGAPEAPGARGPRLGGLYGLAVGALFAGESMFHRATGASKVAFARMAEHLRARGFQLFDVQARSEHLSSLGCVEIPRAQYLDMLREAIEVPTRF